MKGSHTTVTRPLSHLVRGHRARLQGPAEGAGGKQDPKLEGRAKKNPHSALGSSRGAPPQALPPKGRIGFVPRAVLGAQSLE